MSFIKQLTDEQIESSKEIQNWLSQFDTIDYDIAKTLLLHLGFVSEDLFILWIKKYLKNFSNKIAMYPIIKLQGQSFWDETGNVIKRENKGLGSEDTIFSIIANSCKNKGLRFNTPSIKALKDNKIHDIILLDDSINSGNRVCEFLQQFLNHKSIRSWYNYHIIKIHIVSFARSYEAEKKILSIVGGKTKRHRKNNINKKILFYSQIRYHQNNYATRWGDKYEDIISFCKKTQFNKNYKLGYKKSMSNIVFFHSIPNNLPGCLWNSNIKTNYNALFSQRIVPPWLLELFSDQNQKLTSINRNIYSILFLIKKGLRKNTSIATRLNFDISLVNKYLAIAIQSGFINQNNRLTKTGNSVLIKEKVNLYNYNWELYLPEKWG